MSQARHALYMRVAAKLNELGVRYTLPPYQVRACGCARILSDSSRPNSGSDGCTKPAAQMVMLGSARQLTGIEISQDRHRSRKAKSDGALNFSQWPLHNCRLRLHHSRCKYVKP